MYEFTSDTSLDVVLKPHESVDETELVGDVVIIHLVVVVFAEVPTKEVEVDSLLEGGTPNFLCHRHPGDTLTAVRDHVERLLVVAGCHDQVQRHDIAPEDSRLDSTPCRLGSLSRLLFLVPSVAVIGNAVALMPITQPLNLSTTSLIHLPCIFVVCSSIEKSSPNNHASFEMYRNHRKNSSTLKFGH